MRFVLDGEPIPKARPRFMKRGHHVITYDPQQEVKTWIKFELEQQLKKALDSDDKKEQMEAAEITRGRDYIVRMKFYLSVPKSNSEAERNAKLWGLEECICKPDLDNLEKFYLDCCSNALFPDDKQVFLLMSTKKYANKPKTVIEIMSKKNLSVNEKARGILQIFGPERLMSLVNDIWELFELYDVDEEDDWVANKVGEENVREVRLARTAYLLSLVAANHGKAFEKIQKKFPDFWKDAERIAREVEAARKGDLGDVLEKKDSQSPRDVLEETSNGNMQTSSGDPESPQYEELRADLSFVGDNRDAEQWP